MKRFSLDEYLKNPSKKVVTGMGRKVRIICTDREDSTYPIVALVKDDNRELDFLVAYTKDGIPAEYNEAYYTLFFAPEKHEGWVNIYKVNNFYHTEDELVYNSKKEGEMQGKNYMSYIATVKIEWEE